MLVFSASLSFYMILGVHLSPNYENFHKLAHFIITFVAAINGLKGFWYIEQTIGYLLVDIVRTLDLDSCISNSFVSHFPINFSFLRLFTVLLTQNPLNVWTSSLYDFYSLYKNKMSEPFSIYFLLFYKFIVLINFFYSFKQNIYHFIILNLFNFRLLYVLWKELENILELKPNVYLLNVMKEKSYELF